MPDVTWSENDKIKLNSRLAIQQYCPQINQHFAVLLASHSVLFWCPTLIGCDVIFFLFPRLYNLNDCAHHYCSYIPWSSIDVASVDFWRIFSQKHVSKLEFRLAHFRWRKLPLWSAQKSMEPTQLVVPKSRDPPVDLTVFNSFKWRTFQGNCCNFHSWFEA